MIKKHLVALFINTGTSASPTWVRIKKSTELTVGMNPETEDYDYIADESPTTELTNYAPSIEGNPLTMYEDEDDFLAIWDYFYNMKTGDDAKTDCLLVYMFNAATVSSIDYYQAWKSECVISVDEMNAVDSQLQFNILMGGTVGKGYASVSNGTPTYIDTLPSGSSGSSGS